VKAKPFISLAGIPAALAKAIKRSVNSRQTADLGFSKTLYSKNTAWKDPSLWLFNYSC